MRPAMILTTAMFMALAACASGPTQPTAFNGEATARLGETARIGDVSIRPVEVVQDSRCPVDVQCIHAGFFHVRVEIRTAREARTEVMELRRGIALEDARSLRLTEVTPARRTAPEQGPLDYRMTFALGPGD